MPPRNLLCRWVFAGIFFCLLYYSYSSVLVHQLRSPVLKYPYVDITYWLFHLLNIPEIITGNYIISWCFDIMLFVSCILSFVFPSRRLFMILFFIFYLVYFIIFNSYGAHHTHSKVGILLISIPLMFRSGQAFGYVWEGMRYFTLFIYADAFFWKLIRFSFLTKEHGALILKRNYAAYEYFHPNTNLTNAVTWLLAHPSIIHIIFITGLIMEGSFIVGFFTRRFDKFLLLFSILLPVGFLLLSDAFSLS